MAYYDLTEIDSLTHDNVNGDDNSLIQLDETHLVLAYSGEGDDGYIKTFSMNADYSNITELYSVEFNTNYADYINLLKYDDDHVILAYRDSGDNVQLVIFAINESYELSETSTTSVTISYGYDLNMVKINSNRILIVYDTEAYIWTRTFEINESYGFSNIFTKYQGIISNGNLSTVQLDETHYMTAYQGRFQDGYITTYTNILPSTSNIIQNTEHDTNDCRNVSLLKYDDTHVILFYNYTNTKGYLKVFTLNPDFTFTETQKLEVFSGSYASISSTLINNRFICVTAVEAGVGVVRVFTLDETFTASEQYNSIFSSLAGYTSLVPLQDGNVAIAYEVTDGTVSNNISSFSLVEIGSSPSPSISSSDSPSVSPSVSPSPSEGTGDTYIWYDNLALRAVVNDVEVLNQTKHEIKSNVPFEIDGEAKLTDYTDMGTSDESLSTKYYVDTELDGRIADGTAQGQMAFYDATLGKWTYTETSEMFWDDTNKRLGVGTASPQAKLEVSEGSNTDTVTPTLFVDCGTKNYNAEFSGNGSYTGFLITNKSASGTPFVQLYNPTNSDIWSMQLETNGRLNIREGNAFGSERFTILEGGNVGIGTDSPDYKTHIVGELRVQSANYAGMMLLGADAGVTTVSTNANKQARIAGVTYGNSYTMGMFSYESDSSKDEMIVGSKAGNAAVAPNQLSFYTSTTKGSTGSTVRRMHFYESATILEDGFYIRRSNGWIGLGTENPLYRFDVRTDTTYGISTQGAVNLDLVDDPTTHPTLALTTGGSVDAGKHYYHITFTTALGETHTKSSPPGITTDATNNAVQLSDIPVSSDPRVTGRKIYRSKAGATNDTGYYVATIADNTTTTYLDTKADSALTGSIFMATYRPNTTSNFITVDSQTAMMLDKNRTCIGIGSCGGLTGDSFITNFGFQNMNTATTPSTVVCLGSRNLINATSPSSLIAIGDLVGRLNTTGGYSIYIGSQVSYYNTTGSLNIGIGNSTLRGTSGYSQTGCLAVGYNAGRTIAGATYSSWYGYGSGYTANQKLDVAYSTALGTNSWTDANYQMAYGSANVTEHKFRAGKISINGAISKPLSTKTANYTLTANDYTILLDGTSNTVTATLPTAVGITGRIYNIKSIDTTYQTDIATNGSEEIDGDSTNLVLSLHETITIQSDGIGWWII